MIGINDMRATKVVSISMPTAQAKAAEQLAKSENRTVSELFREALRAYEKQRRAEMVTKYSGKAVRKGITGEDVVNVINQWRKEQKAAKSPRS